MATQENPTCDRCGEVKPTNVYNPNTPGYPTKRINLCDKCAAEDNKATQITSGKPETVPDIAPAVPELVTEPETEEFGPRPAPTNAATPELPKDLGPVPADVIRQRIASHEKDHDALLESRKKLNDRLNQTQTQINQANALINSKRGAIAELRGLIGDAS